MDLTGKVAVVTGSGRGLGLAYASRSRRGRGGRRQRRRRDVAERGSGVDPFGRRTGGRGRRAGRERPRSHSRLVDQRGRRVRPARRPGHQRGNPARHGAVEDDRRRLRRRRRRPSARHVHLRPGRGRAHARPRATAGGIVLRRLAGRPVRQLRPDELRGREGRHRGHGAHVVAGARACRHHRQRDRPGGRHRDDRDRAVPEAVRRRARGRRAAPRVCPPRAQLRPAGGRRRPRRVARLGRAVGITGQVLGLGGDRLAL